MTNKITQKETTKRQMLEIQMIGYLKEALLEAESKGSLDYMEIKLTNHQGSIHGACTTKEIMKAY